MKKNKKDSLTVLRLDAHSKWGHHREGFSQENKGLRKGEDLNNCQGLFSAQRTLSKTLHQGGSLELKNLSNELYVHNNILITGFTLYSYNNKNKLTMNVEIKKVLWSPILKIVYPTLTKYCRKLGDILRLLPWSKVNGSGKIQRVRSGLEPCHFVRHGIRTDTLIDCPMSSLFSIYLIYSTYFRVKHFGNRNSRVVDTFIKWPDQLFF